MSTVYYLHHSVVELYSLTKFEPRIEVALEREVEGDLFLHDIGQGFGFRPGSFDGAIRYVPYSLRIQILTTV